MSAAEWAAVMSAIGAVALGLWKGLPAVVKAVGGAVRDRDREMQKVKDDAAKLVEGERKAAHERAIVDLTAALTALEETREELRGARENEQHCQIQLARAEAWLAHLENAMTEAGIKFVPFAEAGRTDSDPTRPKPKTRKRGE